MVQIEDKSLVEKALEHIGKRNKEKGREQQETETQGRKKEKNKNKNKDKNKNKNILFCFLYVYSLLRTRGRYGVPRMFFQQETSEARSSDPIDSLLPHWRASLQGSAERGIRAAQRVP